MANAFAPLKRELDENITLEDAISEAPKKQDMRRHLIYIGMTILIALWIRVSF